MTIRTGLSAAVIKKAVYTVNLFTSLHRTSPVHLSFKYIFVVKVKVIAKAIISERNVPLVDNAIVILNSRKWV